MRKITTVYGLGVSAMLFLHSALAVNIVPGFNSGSLSANDDGSTGLLNIGFTVNFFGTSYSQLYANNNGNVTFDSALVTFTPFNLYTANRVIIAPFFGDVDTRGTGSDLMRYGQGTFNGRTAFGVTWDGVGVGYYNSRVDKLNKFQVILEDRSDIALGDFDIHFFYDQIQWETGEASGGVDGLGGFSARAGYSNGTVANSYELPGSGINGAFLDGGPNSLVAGSNIGDPGHFRFSVRSGEVLPVPDGGSVAGMLLIALATLSLARQKLR